MKFSFGRINLILAFCVLSLAGCKTSASNSEKKKDKQATFLRFHLETNPDGTPYDATVQVYRANPVLITVERDPVLDEGYMKDAEVVDVDEMGGYAIKVTFDEAGTRRLEATTISGRGRRLVVNAKWTDTRWLAAPLITKRISNGVFIFTPDATREETERIVAGLKNVIKKLREPYTF